MPLAPFSTAFVEERFRVKIAFDTNILIYLLDITYPKLNDFVAKLSEHREFADCITNKYALFELYEKRKEIHFVKKSESEGYGAHRLNSDKFYVNDNFKYDFLLRIISGKMIFGNRFYHPLTKFCRARFNKDILAGKAMFFNQRSKIEKDVKDDIPKIVNDFGIETVGTLHDKLWEPTYELILHSRISREDSLIAMSFLKPNELRNEKNLTLLTNDGDFQSFYSEAKSQGLIDPLFKRFGIFSPNIERISNIKGAYDNNQVHNLRDNLTVNLNDLIKDFIKRLITQNNSKYFLGVTEDISRRSPDTIGIRLTGDAEYNSNQNLLIIGEDLNFVYTIPYNIAEFRDHTSNPIKFPLKRDPKKIVDYNKVVFKHVTLADDDMDKQYENIIVPALKKSGNLVFVYPDA